MSETDDNGFKVPGAPGFYCATPDDAMSIAFLGGESSGSVTFTKDQHRKLMAFYGYSRKEIQRMVDDLGKEHEARLAAAAPSPEPRIFQVKEVKPPLFDAEGTFKFIEAGTARNVYRAVSREGQRLMGLLAPFLERGEDPVRLVARLLIESGADVGHVNPDWVFDTPPEEEPENQPKEAEA